MSKVRVLFLCTGNSARSQMAEAFLKQYGGDRFEVYSAGLKPTVIHPLTVRVLTEAGLDVSGQHAKSVNEVLGKVPFGYLITVCADAERECPTFPGVSVRLHWPIEDPAKFEGAAEQKLAKFREVRDIVEALVKAWVAEDPDPNPRPPRPEFKL